LKDLELKVDDHDHVGGNGIGKWYERKVCKNNW
jgi:hypothetical protein